MIRYLNRACGLRVFIALFLYWCFSVAVAAEQGSRVDISFFSSHVVVRQFTPKIELVAAYGIEQSTTVEQLKALANVVPSSWGVYSNEKTCPLVQGVERFVGDNHDYYSLTLIFKCISSRDNLSVNMNWLKKINRSHSAKVTVNIAGTSRVEYFEGDQYTVNIPMSKILSDLKITRLPDYVISKRGRYDNSGK